MHPMDQEMRRCVDACLECHRVCVTVASQHCLDVGGKHVEPRHMRLMLACAEMCRTAAYLVELGTEFHQRTCAVCAESARSAPVTAGRSATWTSAWRPAAAVRRAAAAWPREAPARRAAAL